MLNTKAEFFTLPQPVKCHCEKGYLLPVLQPVTCREIGHAWGVYEKWGDKYQITWQCSHCSIIVDARAK